MHDDLTTAQLRAAWLHFRKLVALQVRASGMDRDGRVHHEAADLATAFAVSSDPSELSFSNGRISRIA